MWWPGRRRPARRSQPRADRRRWRRRPHGRTPPVPDGCEAHHDARRVPCPRQGPVRHSSRRCRNVDTGGHVDESRRVVAVDAMVPRAHTEPHDARGDRERRRVPHAVDGGPHGRGRRSSPAGSSSRQRARRGSASCTARRAWGSRTCCGSRPARRTLAGFRVLRASAFEGTPPLLPVLTALAPLIEDARRGRRPDLTAGEVDALDLLFRGGSGEARVDVPPRRRRPDRLPGRRRPAHRGEHGSAAVRRHRPGRRPRRRQRHPAGPRRVGRGGPGGGGPRPARHRLRRRAAAAARRSAGLSNGSATSPGARPSGWSASTRWR